MELTISDRLNELIEVLGENKNSFASKIGTRRSTVAAAIERKQGISTDLITKIIDKYPSVNLEWLILGKGNMLHEQIIDGDKNITNSNVANRGSSIDNSVNVSIPPDGYEKIIKPDKTVEIHKDLSSEITQQLIESLRDQIQALKETIKAKDELLEVKNAFNDSHRTK